MQRVAGRASVVGGRDRCGGQAGGQAQGERRLREGVRVGGCQAGSGGGQAQQRQVEAQEHAQIELAAVSRALYRPLDCLVKKSRVLFSWSTTPLLFVSEGTHHVRQVITERIWPKEG